MYQLASRITCEESVWRNSSGEINALFLDTILTTTTVLLFVMTMKMKMMKDVDDIDRLQKQRLKKDNTLTTTTLAIEQRRGTRFLVRSRGGEHVLS